MAPEFSPNIALLNLRYEDPKLLGSLNYYEKSEGEIAIRWLIEEPPVGYKAIGGGAAYIKVAGEDVVEPPASKEQRLLPISEDHERYQWSEGTREEGKPPPMLVLILPKGYTATDLIPKPIGTSLFTDDADDERLVLFWMEKDKKAGRISAEWTLNPARSDLNSEWIKLNNDYLTMSASDRDSSSSLVKTQSIGDQSSRIRLLNRLYKKFTVDELRELCFILAVDYEEIPGQAKRPKIFGLIEYFDRRDSIAELIEAVTRERPKTNWREYFIKAGYIP